MNPLPLAKRGRLVALAMLTGLAAASAQDPILKPPPTSTTTRLPAPNPVTSSQVADTRIEVRWPALEGAVKYQVTRSVPPAPAQVVAEVNAPETRYLDNDVHAGSTYYYLVAGYSTSGTLGLKAASPPVTARQTVSSGTTTTFPLRSFTAEWAASDRVQLRWSVADPAASGSVLLERLVTTATGSTSSSAGTPPLSALGFVDTVNVPGAIRVLYRASVPGSSTSLTSNPLTPTTTAGTSGSTATASSGTTTFTVAPPLSVGIAGSASAAATAGRWLSMNEAIATVDATGTVRGVSAGSTQVVGLAAASDGSLRVTAIPVTVTP